MGLLCCVPVLGQEGSPLGALPTAPDRECCLSFKAKEEKSSQTKLKERTHVACQVSLHCGVFWWHVLKTCQWHQSMWIPALSMPSLSPFQLLVCFAGLVLHIHNTLVSEHPPSKQRSPAELWRLADLGEHGL